MPPAMRSPLFCSSGTSKVTSAKDRPSKAGMSRRQLASNQSRLSAEPASRMAAIEGLKSVFFQVKLPNLKKPSDGTSMLKSSTEMAG